MEHTEKCRKLPKRKFNVVTRIPENSTLFSVKIQKRTNQKLPKFNRFPKHMEMFLKYNKKALSLSFFYHKFCKRRFYQFKKSIRFFKFDCCSTNDFKNKIKISRTQITKQLCCSFINVSSMLRNVSIFDYNVTYPCTYLLCKFYGFLKSLLSQEAYINSTPLKLNNELP